LTSRPVGMGKMMRAQRQRQMMSRQTAGPMPGRRRGRRRGRRVGWALAYCAGQGLPLSTVGLHQSYMRVWTLVGVTGHLAVSCSSKT
jgi:hypothetical protein